ncbi:MAG TPA: putative molybdenum carrier protein [Gemmatimonadaceae bacterium]
MRGLVIRSGGQTGVDRAALTAAIALGIPYCGWCPLGGWAEDRRTPPGLLADFPDLVETPSSDPRQRTAWNVRDADATLIVSLGATESPGTTFTEVCSQLVFLRPTCVVDLEDASPLRAGIAWLRDVRGGVTSPAFVLNVAGPRESECIGIEARAIAFLMQLFSDVSDNQ